MEATILNMLAASEVQHAYPALQKDAVDAIASRITDIVYTTLECKTAQSIAKRCNLLKFVNKLCYTPEFHSQEHHYKAYLQEYDRQCIKAGSPELVDAIKAELLEISNSVHRAVSQFYQRKNAKTKETIARHELIKQWDEEKLKLKPNFSYSKTVSHYETSQRLIDDLLLEKASTSNADQAALKDHRERQVAFSYALVNVAEDASDLIALHEAFRAFSAYVTLMPCELELLTNIWMLEDDKFDLRNIVSIQFPFILENMVIHYCTDIVKLQNSSQVASYFCSLSSDPKLLLLRQAYFSLEEGFYDTQSSVLELLNKLENAVKQGFSSLQRINNFSLEGSWIRILTSEASMITMRIFPNQLGHITIDCYAKDSETPSASLEVVREIERHIKAAVRGIKSIRALPNLQADKAVRYYLTSDNRVVEYDVTALVFDETTPYQKVQIVKSKTMGNILVLDDLQNLGEMDLPYTHTLMGKNVEKYEGKEILILGGGDGALLYELLQETPKEVVMVELDEVVIKACSKYMRSVCGDAMDNYDGPHHKIIIGDCLPVLEQYIGEGRRFDYVFGDLTDVPISVDKSLELWAFINKVLKLSFQVLKPDGKFMTHVTGQGCTEALEAYKQCLDRLQPAVKYETSSNFVPSFHETWVFCQVSFKNGEAATSQQAE
ncbi:hypothetical protein YQE_10798, partial [Dendroctonus ponderosae]